MERSLGKAFKTAMKGKGNVYEDAVEILKGEGEMTFKELTRELDKEHKSGYSRRKLRRGLEEDDRIEITGDKRKFYRLKIL